MIQKLVKEIPRAVLISMGIFVVLLLVNWLLGYQPKWDTRFFFFFKMTMLYSFTLYFVNAFIFIYLDHIFRANRFPVKRLLLGFFSSFFATILCIFLLRILEEVVFENQSFDAFLATEKFENYLIPLLLFIVISLAVHAFYFYKGFQEHKMKQQQIIAATASAQFESLKNQIDPHFLFNSLNVLSALIEENPEAAVQFTTGLSKIYRYVLEQKDKDLVPLSEELEFAKTYSNLLKMRFENAIAFEFPNEKNCIEAKVIPLALQLLLENCIKHNVVSEAKPLHIKIEIQNSYLCISNPLQIKDKLQNETGIGLQNISNRYAILTDKKVLKTQTESEFKIQIPILTQKIAIMETQITDENLAYTKAKDRVEALRGFYGNLISYCTVIPVLILVSLYTSHFQWFWFPMLGWGMGLTFHALETFGYGKQWEERKINEIMNQAKNNQKWK